MGSRSVVVKHRRHVADIGRRRVAGHQMLDQLLADERPNILVVEYVVERRFEIAGRTKSRRHRQAVQQNLRRRVVIRCERNHRANIVGRIVNLQRGSGSGRIGPARVHFRKILDCGLIVSWNGLIRHGVELQCSILIQLEQPNREQLQQLAGIILVGPGVSRRIGLVVIPHVEVLAHGGAERNVFHELAEVSEGVSLQNLVVGNQWRRRVFLEGRYHENLA